MSASYAQKLLKLAADLRESVDGLPFSDPVRYIYNPLQYAWSGHAAYLERFGDSQKKVVFMGMNPGPWGMAQTGIPFGEVPAVRDWMGIQTRIDRPVKEHPKRQVEGFQCARSEVSGRRLWGLFASKFGSADSFFKDHFVINYCPLAFLSATGSNITPDKLPVAERKPLEDACDLHLIKLLETIKPEWLIGVGLFAQKCGMRVMKNVSTEVQVGMILHPSPASPMANREWPERPVLQLEELGVW